MTDAPSRAEANRRTYDDARLAAIYDVDNPAGEDHAFFRRVADEVSAARASTRIVDLGCGTGILTVTLAGPGRDVVGIDPAEAMLAAARARPGGNGVEWRHGDAGLIAPDSADLVVMSGNVAMHLVDDDWHASLRRLGGGSGGGDDGRHRPREAAGDSAAGGDGLGRRGRCRRGL